MRILGIETSCDETAAAVVENGTEILSSVISSSKDLQNNYGGVVPEIAARQQVHYMIPVLDEALEKAKITNEEIDAIAVTSGPGLIGSLLVGVETARTLAFSWNKPLIPVNHIYAHIYANFLNTQPKTPQPPLPFPALSLVASGGHTELFLMKDERSIKWIGGTLDDAAGEAFDKIARLLGLPYPGGPSIAAEATKFKTPLQDKQNLKLKINLPRPMMYSKTLEFSFSGLKTAVMRELKKQLLSPTIVSAFSYEVQEAITDVLVKKTLTAADQYAAQTILVSGGVAANQRLKEKFSLAAGKLTVITPPASLCTDNAAVIASYAYFHNKPVEWKDVYANPTLSIESPTI